ncbi:hypothetical protein BJ912DRAFT_529204 [Pholiota molesta]|nr:hypothetical protein BJ912DRAFT_529204 [Pholiota molesta]
MPSDVSSLQIELTSTICAAIAVAVTLLRIFIRRNGFWIDDVFALLSMLCLITQMILILSFGGHINTTFNRSYLVPITSCATTWCARIAILFTIIRVKNGRVLIRSALVIAFTLIWGVSTAQLFWVCEPQRNAAAQQGQVCVLGKQVAILHDNALRHRLKAIFSTCMATSIVAIVHSIFI